MKTVIAFDISKGKSVIASYDEAGEFILEDCIVHSRSGFNYLKEIINHITNLHGQIPEFVLEATGVYSMGIERYLQDNRYHYCLLNPKEANLQTNNSLRRNKTDKSDAHELAKSHFKSKRTVKLNQSNYYDNMRVMSRRYDEIEAEKNINKNRLHALLQLSFPEFEKVFTTKSTLFLKVVQIFPHANIVMQSSKTIVKNRIKNNTNKNYSLTKLEEKAVQLKAMADDSYPAIDVDDYRCELIKTYAQTILDLDQEQQQLIDKMSVMSEGVKEYEVLLSFPGIQKTTACRLIAEIGDFSKFKSNKQLNAYVGIDIARYQSGSIQAKDKINKRGNRRLRSTLFFMIVSMLATKGKRENHIVDYYYKLKGQPYNKHHKVATIACINKFLKVAFHLIKHGIFYDYDTAQPKSHQ